MVPRRAEDGTYRFFALPPAAAAAAGQTTAAAAPALARHVHELRVADAGGGEEVRGVGEV